MKSETQITVERLPSKEEIEARFNKTIAELWEADRNELTTLRTQLKSVEADKRRLDWLDSMSDGRCWVARQSTTGRGFRLHNDSAGHKTVREAIDAFLNPKPQDVK